MIKKKISLVAAGVTFALGLTACSQTTTTNSTQSRLVSGIELANFDNSVRPQDDFYRYVDGGWLQRTVIPADRSNYGSFTQLHDTAQKLLREIIERTAALENTKPGSDEQKLGDFYASYLDESKAQALGYQPIKPMLAKIAAVDSYPQAMETFALLNHMGVTTPFNWYVDNDEKNSSQYITIIGQSGLGLPDRDYYLKDTEKFAAIRADYQQYIADMLGLIDYADPSGAAKAIIALESSMAKAQWSRVENRDPQKVYNKLSKAEFNALLGQNSWTGYATVAKLDKADKLVVRQPDYFTQVAKLLQQLPSNTLQAYMAFHLASDYAQVLSPDLVDLNFAFYDKRLKGLTEPSPRWKKAVNASDAVLGEILGRLYVKETFAPEAKARMEGMVKNLIRAYAKRIDALEWMSDETKIAAKEKLAQFTYKIGYPDKWKDYSALTIKADDLAGNMIRYSRWYNDDAANKLGKPIDKSIWHMTPQTVNAYYNPVMNEIVFPAAILQPPFFNMAADDAVNYGGIGAVIGHELGHGFDDSGAQYDGQGNLRNWWSESDQREFELRSKKFSAQYSQFQPFPDANVNGDLTLGENIGDLGGVVVALEAYRLSLQGKDAPVMEGFTGEQRFFFGWAQVWRRKYREEALRQRLMTDPHSPSEYRVNGIMRNLPSFYQAFDVKAGDKMYLPPEQQVKIW